MVARLSREERNGLAMWGTSINAQFRMGGELALAFFGARDETDGALLVTADDVEKMLELLKEAEARGEIRGA